MTPWSSLAIVLAVAGVTYAMRASVIVALAGRAIPAAADRVLRNVGPAVLAALAINLAAGGDGGPELAVPEVAALVAAGVVAWWRRSVIWALTSGMLALWVTTALL